MAKSRRHAADALLCEYCGYDLAGLTRNDNCPECGKPIAESLPENRTGTPWQVALKTKTRWCRTARSVMLHPRAVWANTRNDPWQARRLAIINCLIAGAVFLIPFILVAGFNDIFRINDESTHMSFQEMSVKEGMIEIAFVLLAWFIYTIVIGGILWVLTAIEVIGISHFGRRRGWRTDRPLARVICAHSSYLWIPTTASAGTVLCGLFFFRGMSIFDALPFIFGGAGFAFLLGMLLFETWVYLGFRAMRYANPPGAERHLRDHAGEANISTEPESARRI